MRKLLGIIVLTVCIGSPYALASKHNFQSGKLISVTTDDRLIDGTSYRRAIFTVEIGDVIYTLRGGRISRRSSDYAQGLIVGDPVQVSVEGNDVILLKPDGKDLKTSILTRQRAPAQ